MIAVQHELVHPKDEGWTDIVGMPLPLQFLADPGFKRWAQAASGDAAAPIAASQRLVTRNYERRQMAGPRPAIVDPATLGEVGVSTRLLHMTFVCSASLHCQGVVVFAALALQESKTCSELISKSAGTVTSKPICPIREHCR